MMMKKAIFIHVAMFSALAAAIPASNIDSFTPAPVTANVFKRQIASDKNWCVGKVHRSEGDFKPTVAVCNWDLYRSFSVYCQQQDGPARRRKSYWIQGSCPENTLCEQSEDSLIWNGQLSFDVICAPAATLAKWAIGSRETGQSFTEYCSNKISYKTRGGRSAVFKFFAEYFGITGQKTEILRSSILWKGQTIQKAFKSNQIGTEHEIKPGDTIQYCGIRGSDALIEGYATASLVKYLNEDGTEEEAGQADDFTMVVHK